jgi:tetratricopeptide (TPR) repeat protein
LGMKARDAGVIKQAFLAPRVKGAFEKAVQLNPKLVEAHVGLVEYYRRAPGIMGGDMAKAWSEAEIVVGLDELRGRPLKANLFLGDKKNSEAAQEIRFLTANRSRDWRAWRVAGNFYFRNQMTDDAITSLEKYTSMRPDTADSHTWLARAYVQKKDADKAIACAKKALTLENDFAQALEVLAQAHELKGQKKEAKEFYQKLLSMNPSEERKKNLEKKINELQ